MSGFSAVTYALARKAAKTYTDYLFSKVDGVNLAFVDALPTKDINPKTIYFVPHSSDPGDYSYDEFMYVDGTWRKIGSTELHLEDYYTKEELKTELINILPIDSDSIVSDGTNISVSNDYVLGLVDDNLIDDDDIGGLIW